jgi:pre-mRNA-processing factor SLU7
MTHKTKDCLERPRKLGAKVTGKDIQADEVIQSFELGFDGKRDRYNGFDPETYISHIQEWEKVEEKRKAIRAKELEEKLAANPDG